MHEFRLLKNGKKARFEMYRDRRKRCELVTSGQGKGTSKLGEKSGFTDLGSG